MVLVDTYNINHARVISDGNRLYVVAGGHDLFYFLSFSNSGYSWTSPVTPPDTFYLNEGEMPDIAQDSLGILHIVWKALEYPDRDYWRIFHIKSTDNGQTWGPQRQRIFYNNSYVNYPRIIAKGDSLLTLCEADFYLLIMRSLDGGLTWQDSIVIDTLNTMCSGPILVLSGNRVHAVYPIGAQDDSAGIEVYTRYSDDFGLSWGQKVALSTVERMPHVVNSQFPSAYADCQGHIIVTWFDYKYGSYCGVTGDILARISTDNGESWLPESRLTRTQSAQASSCVIVGDTLYVVFMDYLLYGCTHAKINLSQSIDWGQRWSQPEVITDYNDVRQEQMPFLFKSRVGGQTILHCLYDDNTSYPYQGATYIRSLSFYSDHIPLPPVQGEVFSLKAYQEPLEGKVIISYDNSGGDEMELSIYNITGQRIWQGKSFGKEGAVVWDAKDMAGRGVSSGIYLVRATSGDKTAKAKITYIK